MRNFALLKKYSPSILSGFLIGTSYIPFPPWATLFCFIPLWIFWEKIFHSQISLAEKIKKIFLAGWLTQFVLTLIGFNWIALTIHDFGHMPWPAALFVLLAFCAIAHIFIPIAGILTYWIGSKIQLNSAFRILILACCTAILERHLPTIFPWNFGYTWFWVGAPIFQLAEIVGFSGLSSLIILTNAGFMIAFISPGETLPLASSRFVYSTSYFNFHWHPSRLLSAIAIFLSLNGIGLWLGYRAQNPDSQITVGLVQSNVGNIEAEQNADPFFFQEKMFKKYEMLSTEHFQSLETPLDFVLWPETAYPYRLHEEFLNSAYTQISELAKTLQTNLITGSYGWAPKDKKITNAFSVINAKGELLPHSYFKTILLAFGEYIPGAEIFPEIKKWIPAGDFAWGPGPTVIQIDSITKPGSSIFIGPQICYESLFPHFSKGLADQGAQLIVNITNDSWYGTWQEPYQHLYMTLGRGVEFRRPVIRATNTGISTVGLASGEVLELSPISKPWAQIYNVPYNIKPKTTIYQLYPWLSDVLLIMVIAIGTIIGRTRIGYRSKT